MWMFGGRLGGALATLALSALLARSLRPSSFGAYFIISTVIVIGTTLGQLGLRQTVVRFVAEATGRNDRARTRAVIRTVYRLATAGALAVALLFAATGRLMSIHLFHSTLIAGVVAVGVLWLVVSVYQTILSDTFRGFQDFKRSGIFETLLANVLLTVAVVVVWKTSRRLDLSEVMWLSFVTTAVTVAIAAFMLVPRVLRLPRGRAVPSAEIMHVAWPLLVFNLSVFLLGSGVDVLILGAFRSSQTVAVYGAAARLVALMQTPLYILGLATSPVIAQYYMQGRKRELEDLLRSLATFVAALGLIGLVTCILGGGPILRLIYGPYYARGSTLLVILASGLFVSILTGVPAIVLMMTGWQRTAMWINLGAGLVSVAGDVVLGKYFGAVGVASATAGAIALQNICMLIFVWRRVGFSTAVESPLRALAYFRRWRVT